MGDLLPRLRAWKKGKGPKGPFPFRSLSDWPTLSLATRYDGLARGSTGFVWENEGLAKKKAAPRGAASLTGRKFARSGEDMLLRNRNETGTNWLRMYVLEGMASEHLNE